MIYTIKTAQSTEIVKEELEAKAKEVGFGLLNRYDFKTILAQKGFPIEKEITVFELCNPPGAQQALTRLPEISVYLPCGISVYEVDGMTTLSMIGVEEMIDAIKTEEEFKSYMMILFENLKRVMHSWEA